jgi:Asp-tRNA(Asn)/Glu-tRNA(Gln) amidotransferase A subunit family amidase
MPKPRNPKPNPSAISRKEALRTLAAASLLHVAPEAASASTEKAAVEPQQTASPNAAAITPDDVKTFEKVSGRKFTDADRVQMARSLARNRVNATSVRSSALPETVMPAVHFDPRQLGFKMPRIRSGFRLSDASEVTLPATEEQIAFLGAVELGRLLRVGKITSTRLTQIYLDRLRTYGPRLNCLVTLTEELALRQAARADRELKEGKSRGPLHGVPFGVKDLLATKGIRTTFGAKPFENQVFDYDATVVSRLEAAGAVLIGKLSMGELAMGDVWFGGTTRCPWNPTRGASGSSAGSCAATAAGLVGFAIGTETLGSIVSPSVRNGTTGLRPTFGRVSRHGAMALSWTMDKIGPIARRVEDCAAILQAIAGPDDRDLTLIDAPLQWNPKSDVRKIKVGIDEQSFASISANTSRKKFYDDALGMLKKMGVVFKPIKLPIMTDATRALSTIFINAEGASSFQKLLDDGGLSQLAQQEDGSWPNTFRTAATISAADYLTAMRIRAQLQQQMMAALSDVDVYVAAPLSGSTIYLTNLCGQPTVVTRCGMDGDTPVCIEFVGNLFREDAALRLAFAYEQATDWNKRWPDVSALPLVPPLMGGNARQ